MSFRLLARLAVGVGALLLLGTGPASSLADDSPLLLVANKNAASLHVVNAASLTVSGFPIRVAIAPDGNRAVVSTPRAGGIVIVDPETRETRTRLKTGAKPIGVLIAPRGSRAFVANSGSRTVSVVGLAKQTITDTLSVGAGPDGMAFIPAE